MHYAVSQPLVFSGHYYLTVLRGNISIGGINLAASSEKIPVSCPSQPYYAIKPQFSTSTQDLVPSEARGQFEGTHCVVEIVPINLSHLAKLLPPFKSLFDPLSQLGTHATDLWTPLNGWSEVAQLSRNDRLILIGPKNSGKSSLAKYVANRLGSGYLLDLDPGQCEYTPPGTLSLIKMSGHDLSASYLRVANPPEVIEVHSLGYVSPMDVPSKYLDICTKLVQLVPLGEPLIVNTPGWTKGLGLELVAEVTAIVGATKAVHMGRDESYEALQAELLENLGLKLDICEAASPSSSKFSASDLRTLQLVSYFNLKNPLHITTWPPYELVVDAANMDGSSICGIAVSEADGIDLVADWKTCIEGTLVAINQLIQHVNIEPNALLGCEATKALLWHSRWIGYAIVQKISGSTPQGSTVRLLTPLDPNTISGPIVLVRGRLAAPLFLVWDGSVADAPWLIAKNPPGVGSVYTKFRRNIGRN